ncbi:MAG: aldo/keto reductase [Carnobacterium sp.]|nr:aldo/keto reductase [Carnobacterium sp.]
MVESLLDRTPLNNGYTIPGIGLGTSGMTGIEAEDAVFYAITNGYRLIDTASFYDNEEDVGKGVNRAINAGVSRDEIFVTTKIWKTDMGFDNAIQSFDQSLNRLNQQYVDLLLIHWPDKDDSVNLDTWRALESIYESGRARSIGVCNFNHKNLATLLEEVKVRPAINQFEMYPGHSGQDTNDFCNSENIVSMAYSPIKKGNISKENRTMTLAKKHNKTPEQIALRWAVQRGTIPIPKSSHKERIKENGDIFDFFLDNEDMDFLNDLDMKQGRKQRLRDNIPGTLERKNRRKFNG